MLYKAIPPPLASLLKTVHLFPLPDNTYMAGGTAVSICLGHRISVDIDLFTASEFYSGPVVSQLKRKHSVEVTSAAEKNTLAAMIDDVRFSLFFYPYPLLLPLAYNRNFNINLASPLDIAAMKIVAIGQRGTAKDFIDLRALITAGCFSLSYLIKQVQKKYGLSKNYGYQIRKSLVYFDDAVRTLGDVRLVNEDGKDAKISQKEWGGVEKFFRKLAVTL